MHKKLYPWWQPRLCGSEYELVTNVLKSDFLNDGDVTEEFSTRIAKLLGVKHAVAVTSGTTALFLALKALDIGPGDEVIVPDVTFIATANAATLTGAEVVLADVDPTTLNMDPTKFEEAITINTRAVVPVHVSGRGAAMAEIMSIANRHDIAVVEDAAEALLSKYQGRLLGTIGDAGCFSFSPNKTITTGQGGMVVTNDDAIHQRLRELKDQGRPIRGTGGDDLHPTLGFNFKLTNLQAAVGLGQLDVLQDRVEHLKAIYQAYCTHLSGLHDIRLFRFETSEGETPQWIDALATNRDELVSYMENVDMYCRKFWHPVHAHKPYEQPNDNFPHSTALCRQALWLPSSFELRTDDIAQVCAVIRRFYQGRAPIAA